MSPNRVAALSGVLTAVAAAVVSLLGAVDTYQKTIVVGIALLVGGAVLIVWLIGWQKHEGRAARSKGTGPVTGAGTNTESSIDGSKLLADEHPSDLASAGTLALAADPPIKPLT